MAQKSNERTFQGILLNSLNEVLAKNVELKFSSITQEENVGIGSKNRFSDVLLKTFDNKVISFELKNTKWDATDEELVQDAVKKATDNGFEFFVTCTPKQLVLWKTFESNKNLYNRKLKIFNLSKNIRVIDDILTSQYQKDLLFNIKNFLSTLSKIIYERQEIWDSIDKYFISKLSIYIIEASSDMFFHLYKKIKNDKNIQKKIQDFLKVQDIFNIQFNFQENDIYNICKLSNYLLYLKIIFYSYLQRELKELYLYPLEIPDDSKILNKKLRKYFDDVLKYDFEMIFQESIFDEFEFTKEYIPNLKSNIEEIQKLNFQDLNCDIIGTIYNELIDNQEQHDRGQHFTSVQEVDIINSFCINQKTNLVLDSACGAGTFLVRAYQFVKYYHTDKSHLELLEKLWGIEISLFPSFLSVINLCLLNIKNLENYPVIVQDDFSNIKKSDNFKIIFHNKNQSKSIKIKQIDNKYSEVKIPSFDACIGNPPYIRQELISNKNKWNEILLEDFKISKINQQSDFYCYYLIHTASFLKEGGRLGYVISSSWLDVSFGKDLINFILGHFKIITILDNQKKRSFETASINTVILILEKCSDSEKRKENFVRFTRIYKEYDFFIGNFEDKNRIQRVKRFTNQIENVQEDIETEEYFIHVKKQEELINEKMRNWGAKYLKAPKFYSRIIQKVEEKMISLKEVVEVKRGFTTGANDFFYVKDDTDKIFEMSDEDYLIYFGVKRDKHNLDWNQLGWYYSEMTRRHYILDRKFLLPIFKSQKEATGLKTDIQNCKYQVFICNESKLDLEEKYPHTYLYILDAEDKKINERESCKSRISKDRESRDWYMLLNGNSTIGDFIFPSKVGEKFRLIKNKDFIFCDKVNYNISIKNSYLDYKKEIFCILNSTLFRYFFDLFSRQLTGSQTLSDIDVNVVENTLIPNPTIIKKYKNEIEQIYDSILNREQESIFDEVKKADRNKLDKIIFKSLGLGEKDLQDLYKSIFQFIQDRKDKSDSLSKSKSKQKLSKQDAIKFLEERYREDILSYFTLIKSMKTKKFYFCEKVNFPKEAKEFKNKSESLFGNYQIDLLDRKDKISFENLEQLQLYYFFHKYIEFRGNLDLPECSNKCEEILNDSYQTYQNIIPKIQETIKIHRIKNIKPEEVYRLLFLEEES